MIRPRHHKLISLTTRLVLGNVARGAVIVKERMYGEYAVDGLFK